MSYWRSALGGKNLLQWEQVLPFGSGPYFERAVLSWKAHRKSHELFTFAERIENYGNVSVPLKGLVETGIYKKSIPLLLYCFRAALIPNIGLNSTNIGFKSFIIGFKSSIISFII